MTEREYIVSLHRGVDYEAFNTEMIAATGAGAIPNRSVDVANARPNSLRNTHYSLTDAEAAALNEDPRVYACELKPELRDDIELDLRSIQDDDFTKTTEDEGPFVNWGLRRLNEIADPYVGNDVTGGFNFTLTGKNIDIVIQDTGIQFGHPEFQDAEGVDRLQRINWYTESGISGAQPGGFYNDFHGHGTHVSSTILGRTFGWAKDANLYILKVAGLEGPTDPNPGIPVSDCFDVIKGWHQNKPVNPDTGVKNPTIVNMSWGYFSRYFQITGGNYRGTPWTDTTRQTDKGMTGSFDGTGYRHPVRVASVDTDIQEMIDAGIHVCIAAGNSYHKVDIPSGVDYDNYYTSASYGNVYYHRGGSPYDDEAFVVGNMDSVVRFDNKEQKAQSSETGPGVHLYAPGTNIMAAASRVAIFTTGGYSPNTFYNQANISGTSMAAPQVAGLLALYLQLNPSATPAQAKAVLMNNAHSTTLHTTGLDNDYTDFRSMMGGSNLLAYNIYNGANPSTVRFPDAPRYTLTTNKNVVTEDESFTISIATVNVPDATNVPYTITGVNSADIEGASLTGNFVVNGSGGSVTFTTTPDFLTEGDEIFVLQLDNGRAAISIVITDTVTAADIPTYVLSSTVEQVNEGESFTVTLNTANVDNGTVLPYIITGVSSADINGQPLSGNLVVADGTASFIVTTIEDVTTEGDETFNIALNGYPSNTLSVIIKDTSTNPTFTLTTTSATAAEGDEITITLTTTNVLDGTVVPFTITGISSSDIEDANLTDSFTINSNTASKTYRFGYDLTTEGTETMLLSLDNGEDSISIEVTDVSLDRPSGLTFTFDVTNIGSAYWNLDGADTDRDVDAENNPNLMIVYGDTINFVVDTPNYNFYIKATDDLGTEGLAEGVTNNGSDSATVSFTPVRSGTFYYRHPTIAAMRGVITVLPDAYFGLTSSQTEVSEGDTITVNLTTRYITDGTEIPFTIAGDVDSSDIVGGERTGVFTVTGNTATTSFVLSEDFATEDTETLTLTLDNGYDSISFTIIDTRIAGGSTFTVGITNDGASAWIVNGTDRTGAISGNNQTVEIDFGDTLIFNVNASGHPLRVNTANNTGQSNPAKDVDGQGTQVGAVTFIPEGPGTYYYNCEIHSSMNGTIIVN
jgi:subtilisin family serine protease/plastocyanin